MGSCEWICDSGRGWLWLPCQAADPGPLIPVFESWRDQQSYRCSLSCGPFSASAKKWWLAPIIITLALFGFLIVFTQGSAVAPFVYTLF